LKKLFETVAKNVKDGHALVLVNVIASSGSTPRGAGATMLVFEDGHSEGTIGGGAVEYEAQKQAAGLFKEKNSKLLSYTLKPNDVADLGMICGGSVTVYYQYIDPEDQKTVDLFLYIAESFGREQSAWLLRRIQNGVLTGMGVYDDNGLHFLEDAPIEQIKPILQSGSEMLPGDPAYYIEPLTRAGRVYIFGGGHVAQELVPVISHIGFTTVVFEDREAFADKKLFKGAAGVVLGRFDQIADYITIRPEDYVIIMTRGHQADFEVLRQTLRTQATYIGCIGSRKKVEAVKKRLIEDGISLADCNRMRSPIGLEIKAETPAEIAVSIAAELILHRAEIA
jgi:xanthine dehydrogenase accessory factor